MLRFACPHCNTVLSAPDEAAGRASKCRQCGKPVVVPSPPGAQEAIPPKDKTTLGNVIKHTPTSIPKGKANEKNSPASEKTTLGKIISRTPTAIATGDPPLSPPANRPPLQTKRGASRGVLVAAGAAFLVSLLLAAGAVGWALYSLSDRPSSEPDKPTEVAVVTKKKSLPKPPDSGRPEKEEPADPMESVGKPSSGDKKETNDPAGEIKIPAKEPPAPKKDSTNPPTEESKKPEKEPISKKEPTPPLNTVSALIDRLSTAENDEKNKIIDQLANMGKEARPAARALCELACSSSKDLSRNAILALEKVAPELREPVFVLLIDDKAANHITAIARLNKLGDQAKPAVPVMLHQIDKCKKQLTDFRQVGWGQPTLVEVISNHLDCLVEIASDEPQLPRIVSDLTSLDNPGLGIRSPFRQSGIAFLTALAEKQPKQREVILPTLATLLKDASRKATSKQAFEVSQGLEEIEGLASAVMSCGDDGKKVIAKEIADIQNDLQFHSSDNVRAAAKDISKILSEKGGILHGSFETKISTHADPNFRQQTTRTLAVKMNAGKVYSVRVDGASNAHLTVQHYGAIIARSQRIGREIQVHSVRPPANGIYQIVVVLHNQEREFSVRVEEK